MTLTNTQRDAAIEAVKHDKKHQSAKDRFDAACSALIEAGITSADLVGKATKETPLGKHYEEFQRVAAETVLTEKQFAQWGDASLKHSSRVNGKIVLSPIGKMRNRINTIVGRIRTKMQAIEKAAASGETLTPDQVTTEGKKKRGAQGSKRSADKIFFDMIDDYVKKFADPKTKEKFELDVDLAKKHLVAMLKELR